MGRYEADIDVDNPNLSHTQVSELVGADQTVLDVGCAEGDLARLLKDCGCRVSGIDYDAEAVERARPDLDEVVVADLDGTALSDHFPAGKFDVVVFADVLEHLMNPVDVLAGAAAVLRPGGRVVVSVPNVTHGAVRLALLQGRWRYTDTGLLDRTHIRFFDRAGFLELFRAAGYAVEDFRATVADPLATEVEADGQALPSSVVEWVRDQEDAFVYQFIAAASPGAPTEDLAPVPAVDAAGIRLDDGHAKQLRAEAEQAAEAARTLGHTLMTLRDNAIGLEAAASSAQQRQVRAEQRANRAEKKIDRMHKRMVKANRRAKRAEAAAVRSERAQRRARRRAAAEVQTLRSSRTWRAGRAVLSPVQVFRRGKV